MATRKPSRRRPSRSRAGRWFLALNLAVATLIGGWYVVQPSARQQDVRRLVSNAFEREKHVSPLDVAWDLWQLYYAGTATGSVAPGDTSIVYAGAPTPVSGADGTALRLLINRAYVVGYSDAHGNPAWSAYHVRDLASPPSAPDRPDRFEVDRRTIARISPDMYTGSGYDRGHLAPNYAIAVHFGAAAQKETFLMSNITPQRHALNAGLWKDLEMKIATSYPARYGEVWVITGPVFGEHPSRLGGSVSVPEAFFLIVIDEHESRLRTLALLVPQDAPAGAAPSRYLTTIAEIQRRTRLDFLRELEDSAEAQVEQQQATRVW